MNRQYKELVYSNDNKTAEEWLEKRLYVQIVDILDDSNREILREAILSDRDANGNVYTHEKCFMTISPLLDSLLLPSSHSYAERILNSEMYIRPDLCDVVPSASECRNSLSHYAFLPEMRQNISPVNNRTFNYSDSSKHSEFGICLRESRTIQKSVAEHTNIQERVNIENVTSKPQTIPTPMENMHTFNLIEEDETEDVAVFSSGLTDNVEANLLNLSFSDDDDESSDVNFDISARNDRPVTNVRNDRPGTRNHQQFSASQSDNITQGFRQFITTQKFPFGRTSYSMMNVTRLLNWRSDIKKILQKFCEKIADLEGENKDMKEQLTKANRKQREELRKIDNEKIIMKSEIDSLNKQLKIAMSEWANAKQKVQGLTTQLEEEKKSKVPETYEYTSAEVHTAVQEISN